MLQWMAIANITPDSFSDGGALLNPEAFVAHAEEAVAWGASWLDIGAESTRPGAETVSPHAEIERLKPVFECLAALLKDHPALQISLDTRKVEVASWGLGTGLVSMVNDVSGGHYSGEAMFRLVAEAGCHYCLMHSRGTPQSMAALTQYHDPVAECILETRQQLEKAMTAGLAPEKIMVDPGIGFAKTQAQSLALLEYLGVFKRELENFPLLLGLSRKRVTLAAMPEGFPPLEAPRREAATAMLHARVMREHPGVVDVLRVHDVPQQRLALETLDLF